MKTYFNNIKFLIISALVFALGISIENSIRNPKGFEIDIKSIEKVLHEKEIHLDSILFNFEKKIKHQSFSTIEQVAQLFDFNYTELTEKGFGILFYQNDSLKFWSDNSIDIPLIYSKSNLNNRIAELNNGCYEIKTIKYNNNIILGLVKIRDNYSLQNKYLSNNFMPEFNLPSWVKVSLIPITFSYEIQDKDGNYLFSLVPTNAVIVKDSHSNTIGIIYLLSFILLLLYLQSLVNQLSQKKSLFNYVPLVFISIVVLRAIMLIFKLPVNIYSLNLFQSEFYGGSLLFPSLGDFFLNSLLLAFFVFNLFKFTNFDYLYNVVVKKNKSVRYGFIALLILIIDLLFKTVYSLFENLIYNSKIPLEIYKVLNLNLFSLLAYINIAILLTLFIYSTVKIINFCRKLINYKTFIIISSINLLLFLIVFIIRNTFLDLYTCIFFIVIIFIVSFLEFRKHPYNYYVFALFIFILSIYTVAFVTITVENKNIDTQKLVINNLTNERDAVAEMLLKEIDVAIKNDELIINYIKNPINNNDKIYRYLQRKFFHGFWEKYDLQVTVCRISADSTESYNMENVEKSFNITIEKYGSKLKNSNYYFLENQNGTISYLTKTAFLTDSKNESKLLIRLDSKLITQEIGYPDLLLDDKINKSSILNEYSYAKYKNHRLVKKTGKFHYDMVDKPFANVTENNPFIEIDGYNHLVYKIDENSSIILSKPVIVFYDILISFAYIFLFFNVLLVIILAIIKIPELIGEFQFNFKAKLQFSMIFILLLSFLLVGTGTVYYNIRQYKQKYNENISEKIKSVLIELEQRIGKEQYLSSNWQSIDYSHMDELLIELSQVFFSDINLYDLDGNLIGSSRPEIFKRGLIGKKINPDSYKELVINQKTEFLHNESIGNLNYISAYLPFENVDKRKIAYINLPFFTKPGMIQEDISNLLVTVINLYVVFFLITIVVAVIIADKVTQPLRTIQNKFQQIDLSTKYEKIDYKGKDEIGGLVKEYNRMVTKLSESIDLLAKSERESAWREMAKQIAHEIKNPLTPMKLSIQYLIRSWENGDQNFNAKLENVTKTLIDQIETLSSIATEFSAFAKMPKPNEEIFDLLAKIENIIKLFENTENVKIVTQFNELKQVDIKADKEQISRVFINLIKNAIQSIPEGINGIVLVEMSALNNHVTVRIEDNGSGIPEEQKAKMFTPSFTTKSSGMGLGLPIVKNIVTNANGKIWFDTELGKGTKFFVEFPIVFLNRIN